MASTEKQKDFFISYNTADKDWAVWIAQTLEDEGYSTIVQEWDFRPGSNFILEMHHAAAVAEKTIAVLTQNYLDALYTQPEWAAAFFQDPTGKNQVLIPVRVSECELTGLLSAIVYIDLYQLSEESAKKVLLDGIKPGRSKPAHPVVFPGPSKDLVSTPGPNGNRHFVEDWRRERVQRISGNKGVKTLTGTAARILQIVPLNQYGEKSIAELNKQAINLPPLYGGGYDYEIVHDGVLTISKFPKEPSPHGYVHISRNLLIEAVDTGLLVPHRELKGIPSSKFEEDIITKVPKYLAALRELEGDVPLAICISLVNIKGYHLYFYPDHPGPIDINELNLPVCVMKDLSEDIGTVLRPAFDYLWNAFGIEASPNYSASGLWTPNHSR